MERGRSSIRNRKRKKARGSRLFMWNKEFICEHRFQGGFCFEFHDDSKQSLHESLPVHRCGQGTLTE